MEVLNVKVPATSANCGPGFDVLGLALNLYNEFSFEKNNKNFYTVSYEGYGSDILEAESLENNLIIKAMHSVFEKLNIEPIYGHIQSNILIPPSRGLGSSATAIVAGLALANQLTGNELSRYDLLELGNAIEGHPDNICPAIFGNLCCSIQKNGEVFFSQINLSHELEFAVIVTDIQVSTHNARKVLPEKIEYSKAVENVGFVSLFVTALANKQWHLIDKSMQDHLHVPYRLPLIEHASEVLQAGREAGALGATISGSGSTLIAYCLNNSTDIAQAMVDKYKEYSIEAKSYILQADKKGFQIY